MAKINHAILKGIQGQIGKKIVIKHYGKKVVVTRYPDMSNIKPSKLQKVNRSRFAEAVAYAQSINNDPVKKAAYSRKLKKGERVYQKALKEFLNS